MALDIYGYQMVFPPPPQRLDTAVAREGVEEGVGDLLNDIAAGKATGTIEERKYPGLNGAKSVVVTLRVNYPAPKPLWRVYGRGSLSGYFAKPQHEWSNWSFTPTQWEGEAQDGDDAIAQYLKSKGAGK